MMYGRAYQEWVERSLISESEKVTWTDQWLRDLDRLKADIETKMAEGVPTKTMTATEASFHVPETVIMEETASFGFDDPRNSVTRREVMTVQPTKFFMPAFSTPKEIAAAKELLMPKHSTKRKPKRKKKGKP